MKGATSWANKSYDVFCKTNGLLLQAWNKRNTQVPQKLQGIGGRYELKHDVQDICPQYLFKLMFNINDTFVWYIPMRFINTYNIENIKQMQVTSVKDKHMASLLVS